MKTTNQPITKDLIARHNLTDEEHEKIVKILGRKPNLTELGMFSVMWSENCSYKSSRVHLKRLPVCKGSHLFGKRCDPSLRVIHGAGYGHPARFAKLNYSQEMFLQYCPRT